MSSGSNNNTLMHPVPFCSVYSAYADYAMVLSITKDAQVATNTHAVCIAFFLHSRRILDGLRNVYTVTIV